MLKYGITTNLRFTGCTINETIATQGDVRLINIRGSNFSTQPCDDVHIGGVEIFNDGRWGRICTVTGIPVGFTVSAKVICRQLGFPFGSVVDLQEVRVGSGMRFNQDEYIEYDEPGELVWARVVQCTGKEERLSDCFFSEAFGNNTEPPPPSTGRLERPLGIPSASCARRDGDILGVACRRFEIEGAF